jgi:hypothetical protein
MPIPEKFRFIGKGDVRLLLDEVGETRGKALGLIANHKGGSFSWPLDAFGGRLGYWLHVSIVQAWNEEERRTDYAEFAEKWLSNDTNILLCLLALERQTVADVISATGGFNG